MVVKYDTILSCRDWTDGRGAQINIGGILEQDRQRTGQTANRTDSEQDRQRIGQTASRTDSEQDRQRTGQTANRTEKKNTKK